MVEALTPILQHERKAVVNKGLALLRKIAKEEDSLKLPCAVQACGALLQTNADTQQKLVQLIAACAPPADPSVREALASKADSILASVRSGLRPWFEATPSVVESPSAGSPFDPCAPSNRLEPIREVDDLIEYLAYWFKHPDEVDLFHRLLDGFGHLNEDKPTDLVRRARPMLKLAEAAGNNWNYSSNGPPLPTVMQALVATWMGGAVGVSPRMNSLFKSCQTARPVTARSSLLLDYIEGLMRPLAAGRNVTLLSAPTHSGGWIDPELFVERLNRCSGRLHPLDLQVALLRLAPGGRDRALRRAGKAQAAVRYALGDDAAKPRKNDPVWLAAIRSRDPMGEPKQFRSWGAAWQGPDCAVLTTYSIKTFPPGKQKVKLRTGRTKVMARPARIDVVAR
ncbi:MAG: DUF6493 family protein, partial [Verrucomicrobiota bacterium]